MTDLTHWDFAVDFTGAEAAALILGIEPTEFNSINESPTRPVIQRMERDYECARDQYVTWFRRASEELGEQVTQVSYFDDVDVSQLLQPESLASDQMQTYTTQCKYMHSECDPFLDFYRWLDNDREASFYQQRFTRPELSRWLLAIGMNSVYQFSSETPIADELTPEQWRACVADAVVRHNGNKTQAATELGITRQRVSQLTNNPDKTGRKPLAFSAQDPFGMANKPASNKRS
jgi:hypothetical protein